MLNKLIAGVGALALSALAVGCSTSNETANANMTNVNMANTNAADERANMSSDARTAPDDSESGRRRSAA